MTETVDTELRVVFDEKAIDAIFAEFDQSHLPGVAVGIALDGTPVYRKGFGLADIELPLVLSPSIRMRLASISKHFTCLAYMLLCEEGKAGIDDPVEKYLPEVKATPHVPTMRQLMGHTSGLRDPCDWFFYDTPMRVTGADILAFHCAIPGMNFAPGTAFCYNDGGYFLLGVALERITGQSLEEVFRQRIFEPVGMHDTLLRRWDTDAVPRSATSHLAGPNGRFEKALRFNEGGGQGGIVSTVDDMLRWLAHMRAPTVGTAATWEVMTTPEMLANGTSSDFGLSLIAGRYRGIDTLWHSGTHVGATAQMLTVPKAKMDIIVMTNRRDASAVTLANQIIDACVTSLPVPAASAAPIAVGTFRSPSTGRVIQLFGKDGQQLAAVDGTERVVQASADGVLRTENHLKYALTLAGDRRAPTSIHFSDFGDSDELFAEPAPTKPDVKTIAACYRSDPGDIEAMIFDAGDGARLRIVSSLGSVVYPLECLGTGVWRARPTTAIPVGGILSFDPGVQAFGLRTIATYDLRFRRV